MSGWLEGRARDGGVDEVPLPDVPGRLWLCGKHAVGPDVEAVLAQVGADVVVCLNELGELSSRYPDYVEWLRHNQAEGRAEWFPIPDLHVPDVAELDALLTRLQARLAAGEGLIVHCGAGIGRAGTVAVALLLRLGVPLDEALAHVGASRPSAGPQTAIQDDLLAQLAARP